LEFVKEVLEGLYLVTGSLPSQADVIAAILASESDAIFFDSLYYPNETVRLMENRRYGTAGSTTPTYRKYSEKSQMQRYDQTGGSAPFPGSLILYLLNISIAGSFFIS
jgi:hypothetical protein